MSILPTMAKLIDLLGRAPGEEAPNGCYIVKQCHDWHYEWSVVTSSVLFCKLSWRWCFACRCYSNECHHHKLFERVPLGCRAPPAGKKQNRRVELRVDSRCLCLLQSALGCKNHYASRKVFGGFPAPTPHGSLAERQEATKDFRLACPWEAGFSAMS